MICSHWLRCSGESYLQSWQALDHLMDRQNRVHRRCIKILDCCGIDFSNEQHQEIRMHRTDLSYNIQILLNSSHLGDRDLMKCFYIVSRRILFPRNMRSYWQLTKWIRKIRPLSSAVSRLRRKRTSTTPVTSVFGVQWVSALIPTRFDVSWIPSEFPCISPIYIVTVIKLENKQEWLCL